MADFLIDIGKVLLDFDFEKALAPLFPPDHSDPEGAFSSLLEKKDDFEAGRITVGDYTNWAVETLKSNSTAEEFHSAWRNIFTRNGAMWRSAENLHAGGHRLILFSNTNAIHCPWVFEAFPEFRIFHGAVLSFEVNSIKPEPEIYQHAIEKYALTPSATLYIDDLPANIATGKQFGFRTHQYDLHDHPSFEKWLSEELESSN